MIIDEAYQKIYENAQYDSLYTLWWMTERPDLFSFSIDYAVNYQCRIKVFCMILQRLLEEDKMRLAYGGVFLEGTPIEQANRFRGAFPKDEKDFDETIWWLLEECPGGAVWYTDIDDQGFQTTPVGDGRFYFWT